MMVHITFSLNATYLSRINDALEHVTRFAEHPNRPCVDLDWPLQARRTSQGARDPRIAALQNGCIRQHHTHTHARLQSNSQLNREARLFFSATACKRQEKKRNACISNAWTRNWWDFEMQVSVSSKLKLKWMQRWCWTNQIEAKNFGKSSSVPPCFCCFFAFWQTVIWVWTVLPSAFYFGIF